MMFMQWKKQIVKSITGTSIVSVRCVWLCHVIVYFDCTMAQTGLQMIVILHVKTIYPATTRHNKNINITLKTYFI